MAAAFVALFFDALFRGETFADRDLGPYFRPLMSLIAPLTHRSTGALPLWNPHLEAGQPFAANPVEALFHPLTALFLLLPFETAFRLQVLLPVLLSIASMLFLLRTLGRSPRAALFGAMSWGFGGYLLSASSLFATPRMAATLPVALAFAYRATRRSRSREVAGLGLTLGVSFLVPEPSLLLAVPFLLAASVVSALPAAAPRKDLARASLRVAAGLGLGIAIGAAALVPAFHLAARTERASGLGTEEALSRSLPPARLLELALPHAFGHASDPARYWGAWVYTEPGGQPFLVSLYPGLLATALALAAIRRPGRRLRPWLWLGAAGLLLAMGVHAGVFGALRHVVPALRGIRYPEKFVFLPILSLTIAAAAGMDRLRFRRSGVAATSIAVLLAVSGVAVAGAVSAGVAPSVLTHLLAGRDAAPAAFATTLLADFGTAAVTAALFALLVARGNEARRSFTVDALVLLSVLELVGHGRELVKTTPVENVRRAPASLAALAARPPSGPLFFDPGLDVTATDRVVPPRPAEWGLSTVVEPDYDATKLVWSVESTRRFWTTVSESPALLGPLLVRRGVVAFVRPERSTAGVAKMVALPLTKTRPFAFAAPRVAFVTDGAEWQRTVVSLGPEIASTVCVAAVKRGAVPASPSAARVDLVERSPDALALDVAVEGPASALVAINQTWDVGWRATIDGSRAELLVADLSLSAVVVPAGRHHVALTYHDASVTTGIVVSLAGLAAAAAFVFLGRRPQPSG